MAKPKVKPKAKSKGKSKNKKSSFFGKVLRFLTYLLLITLLLSFSARFVSPEKIWMLAFFGICFPYLYILSALIFILWLLNRKKISLYILVVLIICSPLFFKYFNFFSSSKENSNTDLPSLNIMSFNVRDFNLDNSFNDADKKLTRNNILNFIKGESPDLICLQEVYYDTLHKYKTIDTLVEIQGAKNNNTYFSYKRNEHRFGITTLSKYPIVNKGVISFNNDAKDQCIFTDILFNGDTIRIFNAHFFSIGLSSEDLNFVDHISSLKIESKEPDSLSQSFKKIAGRLKKAFIGRSNQVAVVAEQMASSPYPSILCTDLNDTPSSYAYRLVSKNMNDAFLECGTGIGKTYNGKLPYFRIDYIFYSDFFKSFNYKTHYKDLSDHYPITVSLFKK